MLSSTDLLHRLVALQSGGNPYSWTGAYVLCTLIFGFLLIIAFAVWEWKYAAFPIIPHEMFTDQKVVAMALVICFVAGESLCRYQSSLLS